MQYLTDLYIYSCGIHFISVFLMRSSEIEMPRNAWECLCISFFLCGLTLREIAVIMVLRKTTGLSSRMAGRWQWVHLGPVAGVLSQWPLLLSPCPAPGTPLMSACLRRGALHQLHCLLSTEPTGSLLPKPPVTGCLLIAVREPRWIRLTGAQMGSRRGRHQRGEKRECADMWKCRERGVPLHFK